MKTFCFLHGIAFSSDGQKRVTVGEGYRVDGGTEEHHEQLADLTAEVSKEVRKDPPQTQGELRMVVIDAMKKTGMGNARIR